ncbi:ATP-binding cassette domain-containing protein [Candidatus Saccharibacteria bacterium]|nr:ATP-binding cassette domain-containing protein [Candidatus Saccharibacteria bacterium]
MKAVEIKNLTIRFDDFTAVDKVSLEIEEGKIYGLLGPNGAGKTTIIRAISTLIEPSNGSIKIFGTNVAEHPGDVRKTIGLAGQYAAVDEALTGLQNLEMVGRLYHLPSKLVKQRSLEILQRLSLTDAAHKRVKTYSGGMRRRLDLGASLIGHAKFVMLDEPTTGLDPRTRNELWSIIREIQKEGSTILLTTQYLDEADTLADTIGIIDKGKKVAEGTATSLKNKLGGNVIQFSVKASQDKVQKLVPAAEFSKLDETWRLKADKDGARDLVKLATLFDKQKIKVEELGIRRPSLDDVFLELTGHTAEDQVVKPAKAKKRRRR